MAQLDQNKLLWVDDDISLLFAYVNALKERGFIVETASNWNEAYKKFTEFDPVVVIADIRMPPPNGIEILRRLNKINSNKVYAVLSSFLYLPDYRDELGLLEFNVQPLDKDFPNVSDNSFDERFIKPIANLFDKGVTYTVKGQENNLDQEGVDPFSIEFSKFMALPITEKDKLLDKAETIACNTIEKAFSNGKIWVLLCGNKNDIVASAENFNEIPSDEEIIKQARKRNRAPYQFSIACRVEDHWTQCSPDLSMKDYPTVTLIISNHDMELHFDTGCPITFFSYEELREKSIINPPSNFISERRNGFPDYRFALVKKLIGLIKSQKTGETLRVEINGKAVREWVTTSYARKCHEFECYRGKNYQTGDLCPLRRALIGRNLLTDNNLALILDGASKKTFFMGE
jgi:hypothetical protein